MNIEKFIEEINAEKVLATNKEKMAALLDKALKSLKDLHDQPLDERSTEAIGVLKAAHEVQLTNLQGKNTELEEYFEAHLNEIAGYKTVIGDLDKEIAKLHLELKEAQEIANDALNSFNTAAVKVADPLEAEVKGKKVKINHGVDFDGKRYTARDLVENTEVVEKLLEIGSGSITLID